MKMIFLKLTSIVSVVFFSFSSLYASDTSVFTDSNIFRVCVRVSGNINDWIGITGFTEEYVENDVKIGREYTDMLYTGPESEIPGLLIGYTRYESHDGVYVVGEVMRSDPVGYNPMVVFPTNYHPEGEVIPLRNFESQLNPSVSNWGIRDGVVSILGVDGDGNLMATDDVVGTFAWNPEKTDEQFAQINVKLDNIIQTQDNIHTQALNTIVDTQNNVHTSLLQEILLIVKDIWRKLNPIRYSWPPKEVPVKNTLGKDRLYPIKN